MRYFINSRLRFPIVVALMLHILSTSCRTDNKSSVPRRKAIDTAGIDALLRKQMAMPVSDPGKETLLRSIIKKSIETGYNDKACYLLMDIASHHIERGNFDSGLHYYNMAKDYCFNPVFDKITPAAFLSEFGAYYHSLRGNFIAANNCYYQALSYLKTNNLTENELTINLYIYLAGTQERLGRHDQAMQYLEAGEQLAIRLHSTQALIAIRGTFGDYYFERKDFNKAESYYDLALQVADTAWNPNWDPNILTIALAGKGSVLTVRHKADEAIPYLEKAINLARENGIAYSEFATTIELGIAYNALRHYRETTELLLPMVKSQEAQGLNWRKEEAYRTLMDAYEKQGLFADALGYQRKLTAIKDSLLGTEKELALDSLELKFQTARKDHEIAARRLEIAQHKSRLWRQNLFIIGLSAAAFIAVLILLMRYRNAMHRQQMQELELNTLRRKQEIELLRASIEGEEQERKRLARELHDGIGAMIFSAIMRVSLLKKKKPDNLKTKDFDELLQFLEQTGAEVRKTAHNMMPEVINQQTLAELVQGYCESISRGTSVSIDVQFLGEELELAADTKLLIYRIVQELVHNIVKHANATHAIVQGLLNEDRLTITVEDNGKGFSPGEVQHGMGLKNLESRVKSIDGEFQIESFPGKGTSIYIEFDRSRLKSRNTL